MIRLRNLNKQQLDRTTKIIIGGASILGATTGIACTYVYYIIETLVMSK
jgi:hypothetical protein